MRGLLTFSRFVQALLKITFTENSFVMTKLFKHKSSMGCMYDLLRCDVFVKKIYSLIPTRVTTNYSTALIPPQQMDKKTNFKPHPQGLPSQQKPTDLRPRLTQLPIPLAQASVQASTQAPIPPQPQPAPQPVQ
ncbi:MAG: hypothetical protein H0X51_07795 [Parachlamydiaceae bacterium]|nr:hypothetical protein [Parachlamydiaceae bacterium]